MPIHLLVAVAASAAGATLVHAVQLRGSPQRRRTTLIGIAAVTAFVGFAVAGWYAHIWHSLARFAAFVDGHCPIPFCDFERHFYPEGQVVLTSPAPVAGFYYSAPFALSLSAFRGMSQPAATNSWLLFEAVVTAGLFLAPLLWRPRCSRWPVLRAGLYALAFASAVPVLHNFKWGQISVVQTLCVLVAIWLESAGYDASAGALLAVPIVIKYYPAILLLHFLVRRNWRALGACLVTLAVLTVATLAALGIYDAFTLQLRTDEALSAAERSTLSRDPNSQYIGHVLLRWSRVGATESIGFMLQFVGLAVCAYNMYLLWRSRAQERETTARWAVFFLSASTPFWVLTSWPHYFVYLPALQLFAFLFWQIGGMLLLAISVVADSSVLLWQIGEWALYSRGGLPFVSNACVLLVGYQAWRRDRSRPVAAAIRRTQFETGA